MIKETMYNNPKRLEEMYGKPYAEILETAKKNLIKAGCPENQIDFVINYGGICSGYENDLPFEMFKKNPLLAVEFLTTD